MIKVKTAFKSLVILSLFFLTFSCNKKPEIHHLNFPYLIDKNLQIIVYDHKIVPVSNIYGLRSNLVNYRRLTENPEIAPRGREIPADPKSLKMLLVRINIKNTGPNRAYPPINWKEKIQLLSVNHQRLSSPVYMLPGLATKEHKRMNYSNKLRNPKKEMILLAGKEITVWMGAPIPNDLFSPFYLSFKIKGRKEPIYNIEIN